MSPRKLFATTMNGLCWLIEILANVKVGSLILNSYVQVGSQNGLFLWINPPPPKFPFILAGFCLYYRDETDPTRNWLKWAETPCNRNIWKAAPEQQRPPTPGRETFSHLVYSTDLRDDKHLDQNWLKLADWLHSHIPVVLQIGDPVSTDFGTKPSHMQTSVDQSPQVICGCGKQLPYYDLTGESRSHKQQQRSCNLPIRKH